MISRVDAELSYLFDLSLFISITAFCSTYSDISKAHAHVLRGVENAEVREKYDPITWFDTGVLVIYIYAVKAESCQANVIK